MRYGTRLALAMLAAALLPLALLALFLRNDAAARITAEYTAQAETSARAIEREVLRRDGDVAARLRAIAQSAAGDNAFRLAAAGAPGSDRTYLLDYAGRAMHLAGLSVLQIQDGRGRILSSGHFRHEYDRLDLELPRALAAGAGTPFLATVRSPEGPFLALSRLDSVTIGDRTLLVVGGVRMDEDALASLSAGSGLRLALMTADTTLLAGGEPGYAGTDSPAGDRMVGEIGLGHARAGVAEPGSAALVLTQSLAGVRELRRSVDRVFFMVAAIAAALAVAVALWLAARTSRPIAELAERTETLDLDHLSGDFRSDRDDEIGELSRTLGAMAVRLRTSVQRLRETERRATQGEMARQVNHDIKNGLVPIRNVLRHLAQVSRENPSELARVFAERQHTLESSVEYLENLARNYARLSPGGSRSAVDLPPVIEEAARAARSTGGTDVRTRIDGALPAVLADAVALRRILDNLVTNAADSLAGGGGHVTIDASPLRGRGGEPMVRMTVEDTGGGMTEEELSRAFDDFYTTKESGTGLGLSVVRRLVADMHGVLRVETRPGEGTRVTVELPAAAPVRPPDRSPSTASPTEGSRL